MANIAAEKYILDAAFSDLVSVVSIGTGESEKIRFARMCARRPKENKIVCEERKPKKEKMTLKEWINCEFPLHEIIVNASIKDGSDRFLDHLIGVSIDCKLQNITTLNDSINKVNNIHLNIKCYNHVN